VRCSSLQAPAFCCSIVLVSSVLQAASAPAIYLTSAIMLTNLNEIIITFHNEIPRICLQTEAERMAAFPLNGYPSVTESTGGSVDKAIAANVSMIKLIQRSWTGLKGDSPINIAPIRTVKSTEMLTVT